MNVNYRVLTQYTHDTKNQRVQSHLVQTNLMHKNDPGRQFPKTSQKTQVRTNEFALGLPH